MRSHYTQLLSRLIRAAMRVPSSECRYRVAAAGIDYRGRIIAISTNCARLPMRGLHAEERIMHRSPRSLSRIVIVRVGATGDILPIDPCEHCSKLARKYGITISRAVHI